LSHQLHIIKIDQQQNKETYMSLFG